MAKNCQKCPVKVSFPATLSGVFVRLFSIQNLNPSPIILRLTIPHLLQSDDWLKSSMMLDRQTDRHTDRHTNTILLIYYYD